MGIGEEDPAGLVQAPASAPHFLIHNEGDHVGVAVQDVAPGRARAVHMDSGREVELAVSEAIPLGHKVALRDLEAGQPVVEYAVRVAVARGAVRAGRHVHVHNVRSARWQASS